MGQCCCSPETIKTNVSDLMIVKFPFANIALGRSSSQVNLYARSSYANSFNRLTPEESWYIQKSQKTSNNSTHNLCQDDTRNPVIEGILNERRAGIGMMYNAKRRVSKSANGKGSFSCALPTSNIHMHVSPSLPILNKMWLSLESCGERETPTIVQLKELDDDNDDDDTNKNNSTNNIGDETVCHDRSKKEIG
jgi:hypothetical protein